MKKEEGDASPAPSAKNTRISVEEQLEYRTSNDSEEFPDLRAVKRASFDEVHPGTLDYVLV
jgi:hypothetical protein